MNIQEVADILSACRFLRAPRHVFITDEPVDEGSTPTFSSVIPRDSGRGQNYRGMQPKRRRDTIFLANAADNTTVPHEAWHAMTGLGELTAYPVGNFLAKKYNALKRLPKIRQLIRKPLKYRRATKRETVEEFPDAKKYGARVRHYILE